MSYDNGVIQFFVPGVPKAQPRPRAFARKMGNKFVARVFDAGTAEGWKGEIALAARPHCPREPLAGPLYVDIDFLFPRPQRLLSKKSPEGEIPHTSKPDRDNCEKAVLDAMTTLGFWVDDGQVCGGEVRKLYAKKGAASGARIRVHAFAEDLAELVTERRRP